MGRESQVKKFRRTLRELLPFSNELNLVATAREMIADRDGRKSDLWFRRAARLGLRIVRRKL